MYMLTVSVARQNLQYCLNVWGQWNFFVDGFEIEKSQAYSKYCEVLLELKK